MVITNGTTAKETAAQKTKTILDINNGETGKDRKAVTINNEGKLTANAVDVNGKITTGDGEIAGWTITPSAITSQNNKFSLSSEGTVKLGDGFTANLSEMTGNGTHKGRSSGSGGWSGSPFNHNNGSIYGENKDWADLTSLMTNIDLEKHESVVSKVSLNGNKEDGYTLDVSYVPGGIIEVNNWKYRSCDWLGDRGKEQTG